MACTPEVLKNVPLFALLDEEETAVLAGQVEIKAFAPLHRIYKMGEPGGRAYVMVSGKVELTTVDEDQQEVIVDHRRLANSSDLPPCLSKRPIRPRPSLGKRRSVLKSSAMTSRFCYSASRWREWTCSRCWGVSFMLLNNWFEFGRPAILTR